ncbi:TIGR04104 family putative zinc finger protein [Metabacillus iocasae]|uniref:CXXC-20-CXXC protein n=1 Tax=Priestia iocasae TaxID=2291674 RepID=A0ABS2QVM4_9BACI|nr:TIGR04104 family putative zinc finger protein [Metabacillus iocasae]MBM7703539.1 CXXC-20-CXXC protein [Metabacillus iocasae]
MPTCQHCQTRWTWKQTFKRSFAFSHQMICPSCNHVQYVTKRSRIKSSFLSFIPPLILLLTTSLSIPLQVSFSLLIGAALGMFITYPFLLKLSNEEEPLW